MNTQTSSTIKLNLPKGLHVNTQNEADRIGISLQNFIRMLLAMYFSNHDSITNVLQKEKL